MIRHVWTSAIVVTALAHLTDPAQNASAQFGAAQAGGPPNVSGNGTAVIERQPELLRMEVDVLAKGKDLKDALGKLKQRRKAAEEQLAKLGAEAKSIRFGTPGIAPPENDQQKQMQLMMRQRMMQRRGARRPSEKPAPTPPVAVSMSLTAEWPLKAEEAEPLLIASHDLEEKIKAADLAGRKAAEDLSPEEEEAEEENDEQDPQVYYGGQPQAKPGEPRFVYVSTISDMDRAKALAEAFERAKAEAGGLAKAASADLGSLLQLAGGNESGVDSDAYEQWGGSYQYRMFQRAQRASSDDKVEAVGPQPGPLKYHVTVTATFALK
ncbi:MAG TPA: SIMPL domain-containing protein [Pirellulales bacterium]|jgi:uncharacterized protein YggE|nr:SIMPL domain-containing protein [Pirellulales bacterium]